MLNSGISRMIPALILCFSVSVLFGQNAPDLAWTKIVSNSGYSYARHTAVDGQHNLYATGVFNTSITINGTTITHMNPNGGGSNYLIKYDQNGNGIWVKKIPFQINKMLVHNDKLYLSATYDQSTQHFDGIPFPVPSTQYGAYCLVQIDVDGTTQWVRTADHNELLSGQAVTKSTIFSDHNGNIHLTGIFQTNVNFHNGYTLTNTGTTLGLNAFHAIYDVSGDLINAHKLGLINPSYSSTDEEYFDVDSEMNLYRFVLSEKKLVKYDLQGTVLMEKTLNHTGAGLVSYSSMSVDPWGNIFLSGYLYGGSASVDGNLITKYGSVNNADALLLKLNGSGGTIAWIDRYTYTGCDDYKKVLTDAIGNAYVIGSRSVCLGGDVNTLFLKYAPDGERIWENTIVPGPPPYQNAPAGWVSGEYFTLANNGGNIIISGYFKERIQLDATTSFSGSNLARAFVAQYGICNTPTPVLAGNTVFCQGDSLELSTSDVPNYSYLWNNGDTTTAIYVNTPGYYWVTVAENQECYSTSQLMEITESELPDATITLSNGTFTAVAGYSYQWHDCNNNTPITGAVGATYTPLQNGNYAVAVTNEHGCTATSACFLISNVGVEQQEVKKLSIYPNPASESVRISNLPKQARIVIRDMTGRIVYENPKVKEMETIGITSFRNGVYLIEIISDGTTRTEKLIVNK